MRTGHYLPSRRHTVRDLCTLGPTGPIVPVPGHRVLSSGATVLYLVIKLLTDTARVGRLGRPGPGGPRWSIGACLRAGLRIPGSLSVRLTGCLSGETVTRGDKRNSPTVCKPLSNPSA